MEKEAFETLKDELAGMANFDGIQMSELLFLPDQVRNLLNWMVRHRDVPFDQLIIYLKQDAPNTRSVLTALIDKGLVEEITGKEEHYQVHLNPTRNYRVSRNIWKVLDEN